MCIVHITKGIFLFLSTVVRQVTRSIKLPDNSRQAAVFKCQMFLVDWLVSSFSIKCEILSQNFVVTFNAYLAPHKIHVI